MCTLMLLLLILPMMMQLRHPALEPCGAGVAGVGLECRLDGLVYLRSSAHLMRARQPPSDP